MNAAEAFRILGIPDEVLRSYKNKGLETLYEWQTDCLFSTNVLRGDNLLYSAPTSGGKTLVAELILLKNAVALKKKTIFVLPYVSLVVEKEQQLKKLLAYYNRISPLSSRVTVKSFFGGKAVKRGTAQIMVCTIDKANALLNNFVSKNRAHELGCIVVDEAHVISNTLNGFILEMLIAKVKQLRASMKANIQIIAMSATVGNLQQMTEWIQGKLYITHFRPVPLFEYIKAGSEVYNLEGKQVASMTTHIDNDPDGVADLCLGGLRSGQQVIVFCPTKASCSSFCQLITAALKVGGEHLHNRDDRREQVLSNVRSAQQSSGRDDGVLLSGIASGVAFHNSALSTEEREEIERAFEQGILRVIVATTTLAAGVNLPAGRVIITSLMVGRDPLTVGQYKQMVGRAGRAGRTAAGESFLVVKKAQLAKALDLVHQPLPNVHSALQPDRDGGNGLLRMFIEAIGLSLVKNLAEMSGLLQQTLFHILIEGDATDKRQRVHQIAEAALRFLVEGKIVQSVDGAGGLILTRFGRAILKAGINPDVGIILYEGLFRAQHGLHLDSHLHVLYLIAPVDCKLAPNFSKLAKAFDASRKTTKRVTSLVMEAVGLSYEQLCRWLVRPPSTADVSSCTDSLRLYFMRVFTSLCRGPVQSPSISNPITASDTFFKPETKALVASKRLWTALLLQSLLDGFKPARVAEEFQCTTQDVQDIVQSTQINLQVVQKLCDELGLTTLRAILEKIKPELGLSAHKEIADLLRIPGISHKLARALVANGILTVRELVQHSAEDIAQIMTLSMGFDLLQKDCIVTDITFEDTCLEGSDSPGKQALREEEEGEERPNKVARTEADNMLLRISSVAEAMLNAAKTLLASRKESSNLKGDKQADGEDENDINAAFVMMDEAESEEKTVEEDDSEPDTDPSSDTGSDDSDSEADSGSDAQDDEDDVSIDQLLGAVRNSDNEDDGMESDGEELPWELSSSLSSQPLSMKSTSQPQQWKVDRLLSVRISTTRKETATASVAAEDDGLWDHFDAFVSEGDLQALLADLELQASASLSSGSDNEIHANLVLLPGSTSSTGVEIQMSAQKLTSQRATLKRVCITVDSKNEMAVHSLPRSTVRLVVHSSLSRRRSVTDSVSTSTVEVRDEDLIALMEQWETNERDTTPIRLLAASDAAVNPSSPVVEQVHSKSELVPTKASLTRKTPVSPLFTPFTAAKVAGTPGTYLYFPFQRQLLTDTVSSEDRIESRVPSLVETPRHSLTRMYQQFGGISTDLSSISVVQLVNKDAWTDFFSLLQQTKCLSFELIFREVPPKFLSSNRFLSSFLQDYGYSWSSLCSGQCSPSVCITGNLSDLSLHNVLSPPPLNSKRRRLAPSSHYILTSIALYSGGSTCFVLSLPPILAQSLPTPPATSSISSVSYQGFGVALNSLPLVSKMLIASYVGFGSMLGKSRDLAHFMRAGCWPEHSLDRIVEPNPLFFVSKEWLKVCYATLSQSVQATRCPEWRLLARIMSDKDICKMSSNIKNRVQCLKERGILVQGHLLDPAIANTLREYAEDRKPAEKAVEHAQFALPRHILMTISGAAKSIDPHRVAALRSVLALRAMHHVQQKLQTLEIDDVFHHIEMPLVTVCADMELHGVHIDLPAVRFMKQRLDDRQSVIESLIARYAGGRRLNLDSVEDVRFLLSRIPQVPPSVLNQITREQQLSIGSPVRHIKPGENQQISDWSHGKDDPSASNEGGVTDHQDHFSPYQHLVVSLLREYRRHSKLLPLVAGLLHHQRGGRVHASFAQLGTATGRMIASHPPLQHCPKESAQVSTDRLTLAEELSFACKQQRSTPLQFAQQMNQTLFERSLRRDFEWVRSTGEEQAANHQSPASKRHMTVESIASAHALGALYGIRLPADSPVSGNPIHSSSGDELDLWAQGVALIQLQPHRYPMQDAHHPDRCREVPLVQLRRHTASVVPHSSELLVLEELVKLDSQVRRAKPDDHTLWRDYVACSIRHEALYEQCNVREVFTAAEGFVLVAADYAQIELRLLAHFSEDEGLLAAFHSEQDVFREVAARWLKKDVSAISTQERNHVKQLCYAVIYGAGPTLVAQQAQVTVDIAEQWFRDFSSSFPGIERFIETVKTEARSSGYVRTLLGRVRALPELRPSRSLRSQSAGERRAVNTLCQGSAADLIKLAMINIHCALEDWSRRSMHPSNNPAPFHFRQSSRSSTGKGLDVERDDARLVLQIHDELVFEVREHHVVRVAQIIQRCMEEAVVLHVPLRVKVSSGPSWGSLQPFTTLPTTVVTTLDQQERISSVAKNLFGPE